MFGMGSIHTWQSDLYPDLPLGPPQLMVSYTGPFVSIFFFNFICKVDVVHLG